MTSILERLPPEIISVIFLHLEVKDVLNLASCSRSLHEVGSQDFIWHHLINKHTGIQRCRFENLSPRLLYEKLIHPYAKYLGYWCTDINYYGGLFRLSLRNGAIVCQEIFAPKSCDHFHDDLDFQDIFSISIDDESGDECFNCLRDSFSDITVEFHHEGCSSTMSVASNLWAGEPKKDDSSQKCIVSNPVLHKRRDLRFSTRPSNHFFDFYPSDDDDDGPSPPDQKFEYKFTAKMLPQIPALPVPPDAVISPGIFKGSYSAHGVELVMFQYVTSSDGENNVVDMIQGVKITGDPNIPSAKITFQANLKDTIVLSKDENLKLDKLKNAETCDGVPTEQPFLPPDLFLCDVDDFQFPERCSSRLKAKVQIAYHEYTNPSFIDAHLIIFSQNLCAVMTFEFEDIMPFQRLESL